MGLSEPLESGDEPVDRRRMLIRQQHELYDEFRSTRDARAKASLSKELREVTRELDSIPAPGKVTRLELIRSGHANRAAADVPLRAAGGEVHQ